MFCVAYLDYEADKVRSLFFGGLPTLRWPSTLVQVAYFISLLASADWLYFSGDRMEQHTESQVVEANSSLIV